MIYSFDNMDRQYVSNLHDKQANNATNSFLNELFMIMPEAHKVGVASELCIDGKTFNVTISSRPDKLEARQFVIGNSGLITFHKPTQRVLVVPRELLNYKENSLKTNSLGQIISGASCKVTDGITRLNTELYNDTEVGSSLAYYIDRCKELEALLC